MDVDNSPDWGHRPELTPGTLVGNYRLIRRIGSGSMSVVFEAIDARSGERTAVKCLRPHLAKSRRTVKRFLGDAVAAANIGHPGIAEVYDCADDFDGVAYLAMEYLEGETLRSRLMRCGRLRAREALDIAGQLGETLAAVHAAGIVHRDLKPDNVYLVPDPSAREGIAVKVIDFGVAKFSNSALQLSMQTKMGQILGTPCYMSPEQGRGQKDIDPRSDIYSLGCILYHMLCGLAPFGGTLGELLLAHQFEAPRPIREIDPRLPRSLEQLVNAMLDKRPDRRPASMNVVTESLASVRRDPSAPALLTLGDQRAPRKRPSRLARAVRTALLCACVVVASAAATHAAATMGLLP